MSHGQLVTGQRAITLKNISPKINVYDKWSYVSDIKLTMEITYRRILTIKLMISHNVFLHGRGSSRPSSLFLYLRLFVDVDMVTENYCSLCSFLRKNMRCFHCLAGNSQSFDPHLQPFSIRNAFINSRSSTVNDARVTSFVTLYHWCA